ncbi:NKAP family protein CG6066-like isoform X1 [Xenia sp. Carnegie-2017]|uniref:NKAP family protein CG6066-like isoform X1 n=1 Tax=Xenia sp. Carnegie-2017 TaxID=2897299 RepID=UPI001F04D590|nr:NKAP family protein CG6066-like isoform X1 [Xenia sp. Carnegie-2017]
MGKDSSGEDRNGRRPRRKREERRRRSRSRSRGRSRERRYGRSRSRSRESRRRTSRDRFNRRSSKHRRSRRSSSKSRRDRYSHSRSHSKSRLRRHRSHSSSSDRRKNRYRSSSSSSSSSSRSSRSRGSSKPGKRLKRNKVKNLDSQDPTSYIPSAETIAKINSDGFTPETFVSQTQAVNGSSINSHVKGHEDAIFGSAPVSKTILNVPFNDSNQQHSEKDGIMASQLHEPEEIKKSRWMKKLQSMREKKMANT